MQAAHHLYHSGPSLLSLAALHSSRAAGPQDYELKRQYLALLPPQQIIDICLAFDLHVPPYIKSTVWPLDMNAAISALRMTPRPTANPDNAPVMDSLTDSQVDTADKSVTELTPKDQGPSASTNSSESGPSSSSQQSTHHSYSYPSYPHAPYYPPPPAGYPSYPHAYSGYPPPPNGYSVPPPPGYPTNPLLPGGSAPNPHDPYNAHTGDDLPSYEEMIVEALTESSDPEGYAPKDLFTWMASHYPLQSNFRPSASQALQKAYKRGRFEKTSGGKYKLNVTWDGGNTSRRTTRRPQTLSQSTTASISTLAPPFTQAPLRPSYSGQPYGYPYGSAPPGYSPYPQSLQPPARQPTTTSASGDGPPSDKEARDAYETAQSILKAINFGGLLQLSNENEAECADKAAPEPAGTASADTLDASPVVETDAVTAERPRAELQARLVLLATQLTEIAGEEDSEGDEMEAII